MQDIAIDLTLAVNYLPACFCISQCVALSFSLCALHSVRMLPAFVAVCMLLVIDRSAPKALRIFDSSSILFSVFLSHSVSVMQEFGNGTFHLWPQLHFLFSVEWPCMAMYLLLKPPNSPRFLRLCFACACFRVSCCAFVFRPDVQEMRILRVCRDLAFCSLCLVWTYVVGLYRRRLTHHPSESATHFAIYFWPVLYAHAYTAVVFALGSLAVVLVQLNQPDSPRPQVQPPVFSPHQSHGSSAYHSAQPLERACAQAVHSDAQPEENDELLFRQAVSALTTSV